ncbi:shikimate dehydrogenase substrate binding domain-containing protein [Lentinula raphanica]|nr:shikimate dehydrogenase substrate binding domain-containing protein [Lentinula raphanica]KAJ3970706.1 shikimate dehydrogenase substrate binding domain-containing protein [Lentinula raphanica]
MKFDITSAYSFLSPLLPASLNLLNLTVTMSNPNPENQTFYRLYGFPIAHSASPAFHNHIFNQLEGDKHYSLFSTSKVIPEMLEDIRNESFGGSSVTMPLKSAIIPFLDGLSPESEASGAVNTIVKVPTPDGPAKLIGTNTDILGIQNALLNQLRSQHPELSITSRASYPKGVGAGVVFGGGATTRSAVYALTKLGLHPIYLVNRDPGEVKAVQDAYPQLTRGDSLIHLDHPDKVEALLAQPDSPRVLMIVGAIPAIPPVTKAERMVYTVASALLTLPYTPPPHSPVPSTEVGESLPLPMKRLFLEMAYKPRITPMLKVALAHGWDGIDGTNAVVEQGFAQQRMWLKGDPSADVGSDPNILGPAIERKARDLITNMGDVLVNEIELDKAVHLDPAPTAKM